MPSFACKDIGMACEFKTTAQTEAELMKKIAEHAKECSQDRDGSCRSDGQDQKSHKTITPLFFVTGLIIQGGNYFHCSIVSLV
jgi:hypothetical protein